MPLVSVLTASYQTPDEFLIEAHESLKAQTLTDWEWVIQFDDGQCELPGSLSDDPRVKPDTHGKRCGTAVARNLGLARCKGEYVQNLDADDMLLPQALELGVAALETNPQAGFCFGRMQMLQPDGSLNQPDWCNDVYPKGLIKAGEVERRWRDEGNHAVPINGILWRKDPLLAHGGWGGLAFSEDAVIMHIVAQAFPVVHINENTSLYRQHEGQVTRDETYLRQWQIGWNFIHERLLARRRIEGIPTPQRWLTAPQSPAAAARDIAGEK